MRANMSLAGVTNPQLQTPLHLKQGGIRVVPAMPVGTGQLRQRQDAVTGLIAAEAAAILPMPADCARTTLQGEHVNSLGALRAITA